MSMQFGVNIPVHAHIVVCAYYRASKPFRISVWFQQPSSKRDLPSSLATEHVLDLDLDRRTRTRTTRFISAGRSWPMCPINKLN